MWSASREVTSRTNAAVLFVDGRKLEQPLRIVPDPRVNLPQSAYNEQFAMAREIDALRTTISKAIGESDALLEKATEEAVKTRIGEVAGRATMFGVMTAENVPTPRTTLRAILNTLDNVMEAVDGADAAPSPDARARFAMLRVEAEQALNAWREIAK